MISVIVPIYKIEQYLRQCVDSLLAQTYRELEIILVDDGSPDNCPAICDDYAALDTRVKVVHKENGGLMSARQAGLKAAGGDYIGFVDGDDWIEPQMYQRFADVIEKYHPDLAYCEFLYAYNDHDDKSMQANYRECYNKQQLEEEIYPEMLFKAPYYTFGINPCCWSKVFKKELLEKVLYPVTPKIKIGEDAAFTYPALLAAESVAYVGDCLYHYRINPEAMTKTYDPNMENTIFIPYEILKAAFAQYPQRRYRLEEQLRYYLLYLVNTAVRNEASPDCSKSKNEKMAVIRRLTGNPGIVTAAELADSSILPAHTRLFIKCLARKNASMLYLYTLMLRRFLS